MLDCSPNTAPKQAYLSYRIGWLDTPRQENGWEPAMCAVAGTTILVNPSTGDVPSFLLRLPSTGNQSFLHLVKLILDHLNLCTSTCLDVSRYLKSKKILQTTPVTFSRPKDGCLLFFYDANNIVRFFITHPRSGVQSWIDHEGDRTERLERLQFFRKVTEERLTTPQAVGCDN